MNEPTQISLANSLTVKQSINNAGQPSINLDGQTLHAKNIVFAKGSVQLDILVNDHWQTLRLATSQSPSKMQTIPAAEIQLSTDGKQLTILPTHTSFALNQAKQLQGLLNFIRSGSAIDNQPFAVSATTQPTAKLQIPQLNANLPINKEIAQLLQSEQPLKAIINSDSSGLKLVVLNRFADKLHQQPISQTKLATWLANLAPQGQLQKSSSTTLLTLPVQKNAFNIPLKPLQAQQLSSSPQAVTITASKDQLTFKTQTDKVIIGLKNSLTHTFHSLVKAQKTVSEQQIKPTAQPAQSPLISTSSPIKSWLQNSFADLKTRITDAVRYFEHKPFSQTLTATSKQAKPASATHHEKAQPSLLPKSVSQINLAALARDNANPLLANISAGSALPKQFHSSAPLVQFFQQVKASLSAVTAPVSNLAGSQTTGGAQPINLKGPLTATPVPSQITLPIEAKLVTTLVSSPLLPVKAFTSPHTGHEDFSKAQLSQKIEQLAQGKVSDNVDLNRLVNQAFNRMISSQAVNPSVIQRELLSIISPSTLSTSAMQNSFSQGLENLTVAMLAAVPLNNISALTFNGQNSLDAILQVLVPNFKALNSEKLQEQLQQASSQTLATELGQIKNTVSQVSTPVINQQSDTNALVQFFLPMRLPPEAAQTDITLGQYKKPSKDKPEGKDVWFVRLNFDYAALGQLQITAELMDKALDCKLLASSQEVTAIAHPHLESLRHKLSAHGLQVGELNLSQGAPQHQAFYQSHAIINIKV
ncbi:flagellar hook-length control protein FliK [Pseudoalteromonas shioyasakiensis]|uniref:flagellar hook-length control protein FliK n=1 Tax=Pseudoalteromonas shioyasakiensis TaxID=1190813 RepID=UPI00211892BE|nr:flagellar hook-length control protein FliK [Pseudoalteromonas shioyasakiensis]MCQ8877865.1 flagellar hook-length control protein FliK [Pseudoalteromonas shioyasakiensis]